ncbi:hypothetical protein JW949_01055 [Candidatus Woesearchaeota archaeon]|nr:hypothetical protein [Candidatus Woesearchaeota archaeon]
MEEEDLIINKGFIKKIFDRTSVIYLFLVLFFVFTIAAHTNTEIFYVIAAFFPSVLTVVLFVFLYKGDPKMKKALWAIPLLLLVLFYSLTREINFLMDMDNLVIVFLNLGIIALYTLIIYVILDEKIHPKEVIVRKDIKEQQQKIEKYINGIKTNVMPVNKAIGQVYDKAHGGNNKIRDKIKIKSSWFGDIMETLHPGKHKYVDSALLLNQLMQVYIRLLKLQKSEEEIFERGEMDKLKSLKRDKYGNSKIIEVIMNNTNVRVREPYLIAVELCERAKEEIKQIGFNVKNK